MDNKNFAEALKKYEARESQRKTTHDDYSATQRKVKEAMKIMEELIVPQSPAEWALAAVPFSRTVTLPTKLGVGIASQSVSPEAEAAFIGPKGIKRLRELGKNPETFKSRFFGERAEINPSDVSNVWWRMGEPGYRLDRLLKEKRSHLLTDILPQEEFPELFEAYPELTKVPVELRPSQFQDTLAASYEPIDKAPRNHKFANKYRNLTQQKYLKEHPLKELPKIENFKTGTSTYDWDGFNRTMQEVMNYNKQTTIDAQQHPFKKLGLDLDYSLNEAGDWELWSWMNKDLRDKLSDIRQQKLRNRYPGTMTLNVPDQGTGNNPTLEFMNSILHEAQHAIQDIEGHSVTFPFMDSYKGGENGLERLIRMKGEHALRTGKNPDNYTTGAYYLRNVDDLPQNKAVQVYYDGVNERNVRDWLDQLTRKEKEFVNPWLENIWWPPSENNLDNLLSILSDTEGAVDLSNELASKIENQFKYPRVRVSSPYLYKMNPYEREAVEASRRDTDPHYRKSFTRKTEDLNPSFIEDKLQDFIKNGDFEMRSKYDQQMDDLLNLAEQLTQDLP